MTQPPPVNFAVSARGTRIRLADGAELIDGVSSWWCMCHGHNHPKIVEAVRRQSEKIMQIMFAGFTHEPAIRLAELLARRTPAGVDKVFFADSGSVAVECAAKLAIQYQIAAGRPERRRLAALRGGYHGDTSGAMALSDPGGMHRMFSGILAKHYFAPRPEIPFGAEWNDDDFRPMAELLEQHDDEIAAVIVEPVFQGANAMWFYHPEYLRRLRRACDEHGILLILDEVATGFGRLGRYFASEFAGIIPDIQCVGKGLTGGAITLAAAIASGRVAETVSAGEPGKFLHGPTFMANPLACAVANESLAMLAGQDMAARVAHIEGIIKEEIAPAAAFDNVADVRVLGTIGVIEMKEPVDVGEFQKECVDRGVWIRPFGRNVYIMPPYVITDSQLRYLISQMLEIVKPKQ